MREEVSTLDVVTRRSLFCPPFQEQTRPLRSVVEKSKSIKRVLTNHFSFPLIFIEES